MPSCPDVSIAPPPEPERIQDAKETAQRAFVFDALALPYVLNEPYTEQTLSAGINAANVTLTGEDGWDESLRRIESILSRIERHDCLLLAVTSADLNRAEKEGKLAVVLGTQGCAFVEDKLWRIGHLHRLGMRFLGLAYTPANLLADGCGEPRDSGLTLLGREFVAEANDFRMILDLSHTGHRSQAEATELAHAPCCTHSNAFAINPNDRNTRDDVISAIAKKGGVVGVCCLPRTVCTNAPSVKDLADHTDHLRQVSNDQAVGMGLDFQQGDQENGKQAPISKRWRTLRPDIFGTVDDYYRQPYPTGFETVEKLSNFISELLDRGYNEDQLLGVLGANWRRFFERIVG